MEEKILSLISTTQDKLLSIDVVDGQLILVTDANIIAFDMDGVRKIYQNTEEINSSDKLNIHINGFYYTKDTNILWRYTDIDGWTQITRSASEDQGVVSIVGTLSNNIIISELGNGLFKISGQYRIVPNGTLNMTLGSDLFICAPNHIQQISGEKVIKYNVNADGTYDVATYITDKDLGQYINKDEAETIISVLIRDNVEEKIDETIQNILATESDIENIF